MDRIDSSTATVILPRDNRLGAVAVGPYQAGKPYAVPRAEAERLVALKGFEIVNDAAPAATTED